METATIEVLPDCLIRKIVSYLSFKEAAKMSILSKTWLQAWLTHPNLEFTVDYHHDMKVVDKVMERYRDRKIPIEKFELSSDSSSREDIEKWLGIALQNGVKDCRFHGLACPLPIFIILAAKSLKELVLTRCNLKSVSLSRGVANLFYLEKLSLSSIYLNEDMLQTLLTNCPLIVSFVIDSCYGLDKIELRNLQKIRSVSITKSSRKRVKIQAPTLEHFSYYQLSVEKLDIVECKNLKSVELSYVTLSGGFLEHLISGFQFLECLIIVCLGKGSERFNILSRSLRVLKIEDCEGVGEIDAPNLESVEYIGDQIPRLKIAKTSSQLKHSQIVLHCQNNLNVVWFYELRRFLSNLTSWSQVSLHFSKCHEINRKELKPHDRVALPQVDVLDVDIKSSGNCPTFVDALLWSCHPKRLNLSSTVKMIICFIDRLTYLKNSSDSTSHESKPYGE
ncbi:putative F-box/LRR-repeat protein At3g18150 isoform X1 [Nicotiana tabacum]|uniref:F-box/LRR-repeat protein At3g18150 isoform X1 n=5 Tax=Nicotiana tabacum TaxID=4097 RepID=A0AC58SKA9_TOBAC